MPTTRSETSSAAPKLLLKRVALACAVSIMVACAQPNSRVRVSASEADPVPAKVVIAADSQSQALGLETPRVFALDLLPSSMVSGVAYEIAPEVSMYGHQAGFMIKSDYGRLDAVSVELVEQRVIEIAALAELERMSELKVFGRAAANSLRQTGTALYNVFRNPEATAKAIPQGIREKASAAWEGAKTKGKELSDSARAKIRGDGAPPEFNAFLPDPPATPEKTWQDRAKSQGSKFGLDYLGYNSAVVS
jgi:hypothetical protein